MGRLWNLIFGWEEIFASPDINQYMKMKNELDNKGVNSRTEFINRSQSQRSFGVINNVGMYYIYVKKNKQLGDH